MLVKFIGYRCCRGLLPMSITHFIVHSPIYGHWNCLQFLSFFFFLLICSEWMHIHTCLLRHKARGFLSDRPESGIAGLQGNRIFNFTCHFRMALGSRCVTFRFLQLWVRIRPAPVFLLRFVISIFVCCAHPEFVGFGIYPRFVYVLCHYTHTIDIFPDLFFSLLKPISVCFTHIIANVLSLHSFLHIRSYFWDCFFLSEAHFFRASLKEEKSPLSLVWKYIDFFLVVEKCFAGYTTLGWQLLSLHTSKLSRTVIWLLFRGGGFSY